MKQVLSPKEVADAVGVSESSLKRWADDGRIRVARTAGGHRRIPIWEAIRFIRESQLVVVRPEALGLPEAAVNVHGLDDEQTAADHLHAHLSEGHAEEARGMLMALYLNGRSIDEISDEVIKPAMDRLGELWKHSRAGIVSEHRATDICLQAVSRLRLTFPMPTNAPTAIGAAPSGDPYVLPSLIAATVLASIGYNATNLGADTPLDCLADAVERERPRLVWLSISHIPEGAAWTKEFGAFAARVRGTGAYLAVGGSRHQHIIERGGDRLLVGGEMSQLAGFARGLLGANGA